MSGGPGRGDRLTVLGQEAVEEAAGGGARGRPCEDPCPQGAGQVSPGKGTTVKKRQPTGETDRKGGGGAEKSREEGSAVGWLQEGGRVRGGRRGEVRVREQRGRIQVAPEGARKAGRGDGGARKGRG